MRQSTGGQGTRIDTNAGNAHTTERWEGSPCQFRSSQTTNFPGSGGGVDRYDRSQAANVSPRRRLKRRSAVGLASRVQPSGHLSQGAERQGQWRRGGSRGEGGAWGRLARRRGGARGRLRPESGCGGGSEGGAWPRGVRACATGPWGRGCARALRGPWRAESRRVPAKGGGAVSLESGAPSGRVRDAGCCGFGGGAGGDVTGGPSPHLRSRARRSLGDPQPGRGRGGSVTSAR